MSPSQEESHPPEYIRTPLTVPHQAAVKLKRTISPSLPFLCIKGISCLYLELAFIYSFFQFLPCVYLAKESGVTDVHLLSKHMATLLGQAEIQAIIYGTFVNVRSFTSSLGTNTSGDKVVLVMGVHHYKDCTIFGLHIILSFQHTS